MKNAWIVKLCMWREARGGGIQGMQSVLNVIVNRSHNDGLLPWQVVMQPDQFSSMTYPGDIQADNYPGESDEAYMIATELVRQQDAGILQDITKGALYYYAESIEKVPSWALGMEKTVVIGGQQFLKPKKV